MARYMEPDFNENDWILFRERFSLWKEAYMRKILSSYVSFINSPGDSTDKFYDLGKKIDRDCKRFCLTLSISRSKLRYNLICLLLDNAIEPSDLDGFSQGLRDDVVATAAALQRKPGSKKKKLVQPEI